MPMIQVIGSYIKSNQLQTAPSITRYVPSFKADEEDKLEKSSEVKDETKTEVEDESETDTDSDTKSEKDKKDSSSKTKLYATLGVIAAAAGLAIVFKKPLGEWLSKLRKGKVPTNSQAGDLGGSARLDSSSLDAIVASQSGKPRRVAPKIDTLEHNQEYRQVQSRNLAKESPAKIISDRKIDPKNPKSPLEQQLVQAQQNNHSVNLGTDEQNNTVLTVFSSGNNIAGIYKFDGNGKVSGAKTFFSNGRIRSIEEPVDQTTGNLVFFNRNGKVIGLGQKVNGAVDNFAFYDGVGDIVCSINNDSKILYHPYTHQKAIEIDNKTGLTTIYREDGTIIAKKQAKGEIEYYSHDGSTTSRWGHRKTSKIIKKISKEMEIYSSQVQNPQLKSILTPLRDEISLEKLLSRLFEKQE